MAGAFWRSALELVHVPRPKNTCQYRPLLCFSWILKLKRPENLVTCTEKNPFNSCHYTETKFICQIQNCVINFLFYEKCLPSYKIMQLTFRKTCFWSNTKDIYDVLHQSCMASWTRQPIYTGRCSVSKKYSCISLSVRFNESSRLIQPSLTEFLEQL